MNSKINANKVNKINNKVDNLRAQVNNLKKKNRAKGRSFAYLKTAKDKLASNPLSFRNNPKDKIVQLLEEYHRVTRARYLFAMIHPEVAVNQGYQVKLYSDVPVPSSSIGFKSTYQCKTSKQGTFCLTWTPNFLCTAQSLHLDFPDTINPVYSNISYNSDEALDGSAPNSRFQFLPSYVPDIKLQKYRLVSALIKVKYNGSVLSQSGTMYSCATFDQISVASGSTTGSATYNNSSTRFGDFSLIRNGLWNRTVNITSDADGIECLYVPMDPTDMTFYPIGDYYGLGSDQTVGTGADKTIIQISTEGAHVNYVIAGQNLPAYSSCIYIEVYANFEVIADPQSAPVIRSSIESSLTRADNDILTDLTSNITKTGQLIRTSKPNIDWSARISDFVRKTYRVAKTAWPVISKFFL